jgi:hypothetical protein
MMPEEKWHTCNNPFGMLAVIGSLVSDRRIRLFALHACRGCPTLPAHDTIEEAVKIGERWLEGKASEGEMRIALESIEWGRGEMCESLNYLSEAVWSVFQPSPADVTTFEAVIDHLGAIHTLTDINGRVDESYPAQCQLLRELFAFRPVALEPSWLTSTVVALAAGIYEEKAFERMPILADALQDAGCDNDDILTHCRDQRQVHLRGCWVLDLLLQKQ